MSMRVHAAAGAINRAEEVRIYVRYGADPRAAIYLPVPKAKAREIIEHARKLGLETIDVDVNAKGVVFIGEEFDFAEEAAG